MPKATEFRLYSDHYARMGNTPPDWSLIEQNLEKLACKQLWLPENKDAAILDFGCGWGHLLRSLWCAGYQNLEGVEISESQACVLREAVGDRFPVHCMDGAALLAQRQEHYDLIVMYDVLEHIERQQVVPLLDSLYHALRPGGRLVVRVPNMSCILATYSMYLDFTHINGFTEFSLMQVFDMAGFTDHILVPEPNKSLKRKLNNWLHQCLFSLRKQYPTPKLCGFNLECYTHKPQTTDPRP